jgi:hypothetical protein
MVGAAAGPPVVLAHRTGELVLRCGAVVVKAHAPDADRAALTARLALLESPGLAEVMLVPLGHTSIAERAVTIWPAGVALRPDEAYDAPWETAGTLLARLHSLPALVTLPVSGGPDRVRRAMRRLFESPAGTGRRAAAVAAAYRTLPAWARGDGAQPAAGLTHGDWHLGQLVRITAGWRMIDIDDIGIGAPEWDLARPAAWFAGGVMPPELWARFLAAYREAGGIAVPRSGDPWPALDVPARAVTVQTAALAIVNADLDVAEPFVRCCRRIAGLEAGLPVRTLGKLLSHPREGPT